MSIVRRLRHMTWLALLGATAISAPAALGGEPSHSDMARCTGCHQATADHGAAFAASADDGKANPVANYENAYIKLLGDREFASHQFLLDLKHVSDQELGATLEPADRSLRAQLGLPDDRGLVVRAVAADGPAARVGLAANDILLTLADKPLDRPEDLKLHLKVYVDKPVPLTLRRAGQPLTIQVRPQARVVLGEVAVEPKQPEFYIGVPVQAIDEALRAHLPDLPAGQGLIATEVKPDSPAAKAGLQPSDILLSFGGKPLADTETLIAQIQATGGKPTPFEIVRAGRRQTIDVTPARREPEAAAHATPNANTTAQALLNVYAGANRPAADFFVIDDKNRDALRTWITLHDANRAASPAPLEKRLEELIAEMKGLRQSVEELRKAVKPADGATAEPKK